MQNGTGWWEVLRHHLSASAIAFDKQRALLCLCLLRWLQMDEVERCLDTGTGVWG